MENGSNNIMADFDKTPNVVVLSDSEKPLLGERERPPKDRFHAVYIIMFMLGLGSLLPWNIFITASSYFQEKFPENFKNNFENYFSICSLLPNFLTALVNIVLQSKISFKVRLPLSLIGILLILIITTSLTFMKVGTWSGGFFAFTLICVVIINIMAALNQSSVFGAAGLLPGQYISAVVMGQAVAGIFTSIVRIISIVGAHQADNLSELTVENISATAYFAAACVVMVICLISAAFLFRLPFFRYYQQHSTTKAVNIQQRLNLEDNEARPQKLPYLLILKRVLPYGLSAMFVFTVTISLFPATVVHIHSVSNPDRLYDNDLIWSGALFSPLVCFLLFNCADFVGRTLTNWVTRPKHWLLLLILVLTRVIFIPLFILCIIPQSHLPEVFYGDWWPVIFMIMFAMSNGYLSSTAMIIIPTRVQKDHVETASIMANAFLTGGLMLGAIFSYAVLAIQGIPIAG